MSANTFQFLEDFQVKLARGETLVRQINTLALGASVDNAREELEVIDAISEALNGRLVAMGAELEELRHVLEGAAVHAAGLASAMGQVSADQA
ncbi:hypothetical protein [Chachezhania antarctica]|uniref:hypothetical protein n=1 Tax=Chachezhania antarctica TaxID=2340860 RepID=UPI000EB2AB32|nr:hypothetical protein [Chachezhania antarctica]|tara:strand:+ start:319 stop:597 length:279 start_codon:yes stop_codon:yes gene_type:complete